MGRKILVGDDGVEGRNNLVTCVMGFLAGMEKEFLGGMKKNNFRDEYSKYLDFDKSFWMPPK